MLEAKRMGNEKKDARVVNVESKQGMGILKGGMMKQREQMQIKVVGLHEITWTEWQDGRGKASLHKYNESCRR